MSCVSGRIRINMISRSRTTRITSARVRSHVRSRMRARIRIRSRILLRIVDILVM